MKLLCWISLKTASDEFSSSIDRATSVLLWLKLSQLTKGSFPTFSKILSEFFSMISMLTSDMLKQIII